MGPFPPLPFPVLPPFLKLDDLNCRFLDVVWYDLAPLAQVYQNNNAFRWTSVLCVTLDGQMVVMGFCGGCY